MKEVQGVLAAKAEIDELAGEGGIEGLKAEREEWEAIDEQWMKADPAFVDSVLASNPQSFQRIMPRALNKFAELAPEQYQHVMSGVIVNTLRESGALNTLQRIGDLREMKNPEKAGQHLASLTEWLSKLEETAKNAPKPTEKQFSDQDKRAQELDQREFKIFDQQFGKEVETFTRSEIKKLAQQYVKGEDWDEDRWDGFYSQAEKYLQSVLAPDFQDKVSRFRAAKDGQGLIKFASARIAEGLKSKPSLNGKPAVAGRVEKAFKLFSRGATTPKPAPKPSVAGAKPVPAPQGWTKIPASAAPRPEDIDLARTPFGMRMKKGAVLKTGKKVFWGDAAPSF